MPTVVPSAAFSQIFVLGLAIKLGGCVASWHHGFRIGVWGFFATCMMVAVAYTMLNLCVAEITSIVVFPGGHFGYVRASLGPFWGFIAGMMGLVESVFLVAVSMLKFSQALRETFAFSRLLVALLWWAGYLLILCLHVRGGATQWRFVSIITAVTAISLLVYLTGSIHFVNINEHNYHTIEDGFHGDAVDGLSLLYLPCWFFVGIDLLPTVSEEVAEASKNIPRAVLLLMTVMFVVCVWLQTIVAGLEPTLHSHSWHKEHVFPLSYSFGLIFGIPQHVGTAFSIAPSFLSSFGFMFVAGRQVNAMARSGLLPRILSTTCSTNKTPVGGMLFVSAAALAALSGVWYVDPYTLLFRIAISGSCIVYILVLFSFIQFRRVYSTMNRQFTNPLGVPSAILGIICFTLIEVCVLFIFPLKNNFYETYGFVVFIVLCVLYYWTVVVKTQTFSEDEQKIFMRAYIINANNKRKRTLVTRARHSPTGKATTATTTKPVRRGSMCLLDRVSACSDETARRTTTSMVFPVNNSDEEDERPSVQWSWKPGAGAEMLEEGTNFVDEQEELSVCEGKKELRCVLR